MSKNRKFLSFFHGGDIDIAPGTKVIPADIFSSLLDASELLAKTKEDEKTYRIEVATELEKERDKARQEGFLEGLSQWADQIKRLEEEILRVHGETRKLVVPIAIGAAKKIVGRELETSSDTVVDIVENALKAVSAHRIVTIYVNPQDLEPVDQARQRLREVFDRLESLSVQSRDDIERGGCIVQTEAGIINAELQHQWRLLEQIISSKMQVGEALKSDHATASKTKIKDETDLKTESKPEQHPNKPHG